MIGSRGILSPEVRPLLDQERTIPEQPAAVRARALTRARAAVVAGLATPVAPSRARLWVRRANAATLAGLACATVGVVAYEVHSKIPQVGVGPSRSSASSPVVTDAKRPAAKVGVRFEEMPLPLIPIPASQPSAADAFRAELRLLVEARDAVSRGDFSDALSRIVEHARRFKKSQLAEEREVLRIKSLVGLGRTQKALSAGSMFRARFPRSVLLPEMEQILAAVCP